MSSIYDFVRCGHPTALLNSIELQSKKALAGAEGFEPPKAVLETAGLPLAYAPVLINLLICLPILILSRDEAGAFGSTGKTFSSRDALS